MILDKIETLWASKHKVFAMQDLALYWQESDFNKLKELSRYYVNKKRLIRLKNGLFSLVEEPERLEIAQKAYRPSYISLQTAIGIHGINFQYYSSVYCVADKNRTIQIGDQKFIYKQVKKEILYNPIGLIQEENYVIASPERAICDTLYLTSTAAFDYVDRVNSELIFDIAKIYDKSHIIDTIKRYFPL